MERIERYEVGDTDINGNKVKYVHSYGSVDWGWKDEEGNYHLIRDGEELTKGKKAKYVYSYESGDWEWEDEEGNWHLIRDGVELTKGKKAKYVHSYGNGDWMWKDEEGNEYLMKGEAVVEKGKSKDGGIDGCSYCRKKDMRSVVIYKYESKEVDGKTKSVKVEDCKGYFHQWGMCYEEFENGPGNYTVAIVELEDGNVVNVWSDMIRFID
jgi:hypothetical protein